MHGENLKLMDFSCSGKAPMACSSQQSNTSQGPVLDGLLLSWMRDS